jgi:hypothetical protein
MRTSKQQRYDRFRAKENASKYHWDRMTKEEKKWLIAFEVSEYEAERGHMYEAVDALLKVEVSLSDNYIAGMRERRETVRRTNPQVAESLTSQKTKKRKTGSRLRSDYDSADYVRVMPGKILKDDLGFDAVYSVAEAEQKASGDADHTDDHLADKVYKPFTIEAGLNPDETAVMVNPEDGMIEAIDQARSKNRSLEKLVMDAKLSKEAKELLAAKAQAMVYEATTYSKHANLILDMNFIYRAPNGQLWVTDQHGRLQTLALYLKRRTSESIVTHAEVSYPSLLQNWVFQKGKRSDIEGKAVQYEAL